MKQNKREFRVIVVLLAMILINFPILSIFNVSGVLFGLPLIFLFLFSFWAIMILITLRLTKK